MSKYYRSLRTRNLYDPTSSDSFIVSRSKLDLFLKCPRCFYVDRRLGVGHPPGYPFTLNTAVDALLKKEFDHYRGLQQPHPLFFDHQINAIPFAHPEMNRWRDSLHGGIRYTVPQTNLIITGGVDDIWTCSETKSLIIVDYKATSKAEPVTLDADWQIGYKRQAEIYQWLFRKNGFTVLDTAYFVYCNGRTDHSRFDKRLEFDVSIIPYKGNDGWVSDTIMAAYKCLQSNEIPNHSEVCDYCQYYLAASAVFGAGN